MTLKALVLLDAGEGVIGDALKQIDLDTWSFHLTFYFLHHKISTYMLTVRDTLSDSLVAAVCPLAELSLETGQVRLEMLHTLGSVIRFRIQNLNKLR